MIMGNTVYNANGIVLSLYLLKRCMPESDDSLMPTFEMPFTLPESYCITQHSTEPLLL